jgi:hypothetical protein
MNSGPEEVVFERVRNAVDALKATARALDPICVDGGDAAALFEIVSEGERVCAAMKALMARRVDETGAWRKGGHRSAAHWVAESTGSTVGAAARTLETARALDVLPDTDSAFRAGQLSEVQAEQSNPLRDALEGAIVADTKLSMKDLTVLAVQNDPGWSFVDQCQALIDSKAYRENGRRKS